jgi:hypothetical protein
MAARISYGDDGAMLLPHLAGERLIFHAVPGLTEDGKRLSRHHLKVRSAVAE